MSQQAVTQFPTLLADGTKTTAGVGQVRGQWDEYVPGVEQWVLDQATGMLVPYHQASNPKGIPVTSSVLATKPVDPWAVMTSLSPPAGVQQTLYDSSGKPVVVEEMTFFTSYMYAKLQPIVRFADGSSWILGVPAGIAGTANLSPSVLQSIGGETSLWKLLKYDTVTNVYALMLKRPFSAPSGFKLCVLLDAAPYNVVVTASGVVMAV